MRDKEFEWLKEIGIQGVKIDFFGGDSIGIYPDRPTIRIDLGRGALG